MRWMKEMLRLVRLELAEGIYRGECGGGKEGGEQEQSEATPRWVGRRVVCEKRGNSW
jgi:hypothetical protein